jgi:hypothetical protein
MLTTHVIVDLFSGRSDTLEFRLTAGEAQQLQEILDGLAPAACGPMWLSPGYRGFLLRPVEGASAGDKWIRIYRESIRYGDPWGETGTATCRADPQQEAQHLLLAAALPHLSPDVSATLARQIAASSAEIAGETAPPTLPSLQAAVVLPAGVSLGGMQQLRSLADADISPQLPLLVPMTETLPAGLNRATNSIGWHPAQAGGAAAVELYYVGDGLLLRFTEAKLSARMEPPQRPYQMTEVRGRPAYLLPPTDTEGQAILWEEDGLSVGIGSGGSRSVSADDLVRIANGMQLLPQQR